MTQEKNWAQAGIEPRLDEIMNDPIVHLVMARDNLNVDDVWQMVNTVRKPHNGSQRKPLRACAPSTGCAA